MKIRYLVCLLIQDRFFGGQVIRISPISNILLGLFGRGGVMRAAFLKKKQLGSAFHQKFTFSSCEHAQIISIFLTILLSIIPLVSTGRANIRENYIEYTHNVSLMVCTPDPEPIPGGQVIRIRPMSTCYLALFGRGEVLRAAFLKKKADRSYF